MIFRRLHDAGVLGLNARNAEIIARWNPRHLYPRVDDKVLTKTHAVAAGIPVPRLITVIEAHGDVRTLPVRVAAEASFVVKPVHGAMGNGVLVVTGRDGDAYVRAGGERLSERDLAYHVTGVLAGLHSLGGRVDRAMVEERLVADPAFDGFVHGGVPDVRVIVFRGVPLLAMVRLPTRESGGRANLHQGAVAVGLALADGRAIHAVHHGKSIATHPDSGRALRDLVMPRWRESLLLAARSADAFGLGYLGVDVVLDATRGPVLLEANARPGLTIQLANQRGLWPRIRAVEALALDGVSPEDRVAMALTLPD